MDALGVKGVMGEISGLIMQKAEDDLTYSVSPSQSQPAHQTYALNDAHLQQHHAHHHHNKTNNFL